MLVPKLAALSAIFRFGISRNLSSLFHPSHDAENPLCGLACERKVVQLHYGGDGVGVWR